VSKCFSVLGYLILCSFLIGWSGCTNPSSPPGPTPQAPDNRSWATLGPAGFSAGGVSDVSLAVSSTGVLFAAYNDATQGDKVTVQRFNGTAWELVGPAGFGPIVTSRLALDSADRPTIVFDDPANQTQALAMQFDGAAWQSAGSAAYGGNFNVFDTSAASGGGNLVAAFSNSTTANHNPIVFQRTGTTWTALTPNPADLFDQLNYHWSGSLAVDGAGVSYIATQDHSVNGKATVMKWTGTNWTRVGPAGFSQGGVTNGADVFVPALAFDSANRPYMAYIQDQAGAAKVSVMKFNGTDWALVGPEGISPVGIESTNMVIDTLDIPLVSYVHTSGTVWAVEVLKFNGTAWVGTASGGVGAVGMTTSVSTAFVRGASGAVYQAFRDHNAGDRLTVMAYR